MNKISDISATQSDLQNLEKIPHSIEAEQQILGAILTNNEIYDRVSQIIKDAHFFDPVHAKIFAIAEARINDNVGSRHANIRTNSLDI